MARKIWVVFAGGAEVIAGLIGKVLYNMGCCVQTLKLISDF
jgi:hypothetical protein